MLTDLEKARVWLRAFMVTRLPEDEAGHHAKVLLSATEPVPPGELADAVDCIGRIPIEVSAHSHLRALTDVQVEAICTVLRALHQQQVERPEDSTNLVECRAEFVYEAARLEAVNSCRPIIPEPWSAREEAFRVQFLQVIERLCLDNAAPTTPEAEHESWVRAYQEMGWVYGPQRDLAKKTHPDMVPFHELPDAERQKDAIFLMFCDLAKRFIVGQAAQPEADPELVKSFSHFGSHWLDKWRRSRLATVKEYQQTILAIRQVLLERGEHDGNAG